MDNKDPDLFAWRNQGKQFKLGDEDDVGVSAMISLDDSMLCVMRKSVHSIRLADSVDSNRINATIPDVKQKILSHGSDSPFVGRTLLQANVLFQSHHLAVHVDCSRAISISFSFLKEIIALNELAAAYIAEEGTKNALFTGKTDEDESLSVPSIDTVEQQTKQFIISADHATRHLIELTQLFYPEIKNGAWSKSLIEKLKGEVGENHPSYQFVESIIPIIGLGRNLRNAIEHPKTGDNVQVRNYRLAQSGKMKTPTIQYDHKETPLSEMLVSQFMALVVENLLTSFEVLMVHLCNIHAVPFAGDKRSVVEIPEANRELHNPHMRFVYHIAWTR